MTNMRRRLSAVRDSGEQGTMLPFLVGLVIVLFMILALGWDGANWFLGHRALNNLADGAAIAAGSDINVTRYYASGGTDIRVLQSAAQATIADYMRRSAGDSGVRGARVTAVTVDTSAGRPAVTVRLGAPPQILFLRWLALGLLPNMTAEATASVTPRG